MAVVPVNVRGARRWQLLVRADGATPARRKMQFTPSVYVRLSAEFIARHAAGDRSALCHEDAAENALGLAHGFRIFFVYAYDEAQRECKVWVITEADRSSICALYRRTTDSCLPAVARSTRSLHRSHRA